MGVSGSVVATMHQVRIENDFESWRSAARRLLIEARTPDEVIWDDRTQALLDLGQSAALGNLPPGVRRDSAGSGGEGSAPNLRVPADFIAAGRRIACHRSGEKWNLLYRVLWRISRGGEPNLLQITVDDDVHRLERMRREVGHDAHRMEAFVRFRRIVGDDGQAHYIAWHRPDHYVTRLTAPFFRDRFKSMRFSILTPDASVDWDGHVLRFGPGTPRSEAPAPDELEGLWRTYYAGTFNPARVNPKVMTQHMPRRYWDCLPEAQEIAQLLEQAPALVREMIMPRRADAKCPGSGSAADFIPAAVTSLKVLAAAARDCRGCDLYCHATQTVFGAGAVDARLMFIGEQPGDAEDLSGEPFVGPAGQLLDEVLAEVGIDRTHSYVTNAVKHFKFEQRGKRRIHAKPSAREVSACKPWLKAEVRLLRPSMIVCLGATAAGALFGAGFRITRQRGEVLSHELSPWVMATYHPSALLRTPNEDRRAVMRRQFTDDLSRVAEQLHRTQ